VPLNRVIDPSITFRAWGSRTSCCLGIEGALSCGGESWGRPEGGALPNIYVFGSRLNGTQAEHGNRPPVLLGDPGTQPGG
jgi:hypothetical protein